MNNAKVLVFDKPIEVAKAFAEKLIEWTAGEEPFHLALSGGSTPKLLFSLLAKHYAKKLPWERLHFWWGDERCVPPDHPDSNYRMTRYLLFSQVSIPKENIHRIKGEIDPEAAAISYSIEIAAHVVVRNKRPVFDLIMLGMGDDGHTASIFPHEIQFLRSPKICEVATHPDSGQHRVTLTGGVINAATKVAFLVTGEKKAEKISEIFNHSPESARYPAKFIQPRDGELYWFLDQAAKGKT